jgi:hypothetical protein
MCRLHRIRAPCGEETRPRNAYSETHRTRHTVREPENKEATRMSWLTILNTFAGTAGIASIAYLAWAAWICTRDAPTIGRARKPRRARRTSPWTVEHSR